MSQTVSKLRFIPARPTWQDRVAGVWHRLVSAWQAEATRRQLAQMTDHELSDVGMSRAQVQFETERPIWDLVPENRR